MRTEPLAATRPVAPLEPPLEALDPPVEPADELEVVGDDSATAPAASLPAWKPLSVSLNNIHQRFENEDISTMARTVGSPPPSATAAAW